MPVWNERYVWAMQSVLSSATQWDEVKTALSLKAQGYPPDKWPVNYVGSHDKERLATWANPHLADPAGHDPVGHRKRRASALDGDEYGETGSSRDAAGLPLGVAPLLWKPETPWLPGLIRRMLWLRTQYPVFEDSGTRRFSWGRRTTFWSMNACSLFGGRPPTEIEAGSGQSGAPGPALRAGGRNRRGGGQRGRLRTSAMQVPTCG